MVSRSVKIRSAGVRVFTVLVALLGATTALSFSADARAQIMGGVSGPKVTAGEQAVEYRVAWVSETGGFAHRLHYQHAVSDRLRFRIVALQNNAGGDLRFRSAAIESQYQFIKNTHGWNSAIQLQGRVPDGNDGPGRVRIAWINSIDLAQDWEIRAVLLGAREIGDNARDGIWLETRSEATYNLGRSYHLGAQLFNSYNSTANMGNFNDQSHAVGPVLKGKLGKRAGFNLSALFGLSDRAPDTNLRLFVSYAL